MGKTNPMKSWTLTLLAPSLLILIPLGSTGASAQNRTPADLERLFLLAPLMSMPTFAEGIESQVSGTWSGNWSPKGSVLDAVTVELQLNAGKLTGKFRTPAPMEFTKASFDSKTGAVAAEASDSKSGKHYKLAGKIEGTELKGSLDVNETTGEIRLIKWTFFGH